MRSTQPTDKRGGEQMEKKEEKLRPRRSKLGLGHASKISQKWRRRMKT